MRIPFLPWSSRLGVLASWRLGVAHLFSRKNLKRWGTRSSMSAIGACTGLQWLPFRWKAGCLSTSLDLEHRSHPSNPQRNEVC